MDIFWKKQKLKGNLVINSKTKQFSYTINKKHLPKGFIKKIPDKLKIKLRKK